MKCHLCFVVGRLLILLVVSFIIVVFAFSQVADLTVRTNKVENVDKKSGEYLETQSLKADAQNVFSDVSSLIKTPISLLYFDVYMQNYFQAEAVNEEEKIPVLINVDINGEYTPNVKFGVITKVVEGIRGSEIFSYSVTCSFVLENGVNLSTSTIFTKGSFYDLSVWPTWQSFLFSYFVAGIPLAYAFLALINLCGRFILFGSPFVGKR